MKFLPPPPPYLRPVPKDPDPASFKFRPFACDVAPSLCGDCTFDPCPLGYVRDTPKPNPPKGAA